MTVHPKSRRSGRLARVTSRRSRVLQWSMVAWWVRKVTRVILGPKVQLVPREIQDRKETRVIQATRGLLVPLGQPGLPAIRGQLAMLGPRVRQETPVQQATRARLETLAQLAQPVPMALPARKDRRAIRARQGIKAP